MKKLFNIILYLNTFWFPRIFDFLFLYLDRLLKYLLRNGRWFSFNLCSRMFLISRQNLSVNCLYFVIWWNGIGRLVVVWKSINWMYDYARCSSRIIVKIYHRLINQNNTNRIGNTICIVEFCPRKFTLLDWKWTFPSAAFLYAIFFCSEIFTRVRTRVALIPRFIGSS